MSLTNELLAILADGKFHSGPELGSNLKVSRSAIWKILQRFPELGIEVVSLKGKGYQIPNGLELLDLTKIKTFLPPLVKNSTHIELHQEITSTNQYLIDHQATKLKGSIILAEHQTKGRGRRLRKWYSPFGSNLYISLLWTFDKDPIELSGLSLATGVAVVNTLERYGIHGLQLKWPNDILWCYKKLSGVLIEMTAESYSSTQVIIGIGLNINMPPNQEIDQPFIDIATITGQRPERNRLAALLIQEIIEMLWLFEEKGLGAFFKHWQALDAYYRQPVMVTTPQQTFKGIGNGINRQGEYILLNHDNEEIKFLHGEVSLRAKN